MSSSSDQGSRPRAGERDTLYRDFYATDFVYGVGCITAWPCAPGMSRENMRRAGPAPTAGRECAHQRLALGDRGAEMRGAKGEVAVVQIIGLDARLDEARIERESSTSSLTSLSTLPPTKRDPAVGGLLPRTPPRNVGRQFAG